MPDLAQWFSCNVELAGVKPTHRARTPREAESVDEIRPPRLDERGTTDRSRDSLYVIIAAIALTAAIAFAAILSLYISRSTQPNRQQSRQSTSKIWWSALSRSDRRELRIKRTSFPAPLGAGQFLDDTWLEAVRTHRRDLTKGRRDKELLKLRRDAELTREIITRLIEQYATTLQKWGLPLTPGSLYLAYFAGPAGAVALLSGAEHADAASVMAAADATGRTTRQKLVRANPFLEVLTVGDLRNWADHKMHGI